MNLNKKVTSKVIYSILDFFSFLEYIKIILLKKNTGYYDLSSGISLYINVLPGNNILDTIPGKTNRKRGSILMKAHKIVPALAWSKVLPASAL
jgi:hypothetical protein